MISNSNQGAAFADYQSQIKDTVSRLNDPVVAMEVRDRGERVRNERQGREMRNRGERVKDERQNIGERVRLNIIFFFTILTTMQFYV